MSRTTIWSSANSTIPWVWSKSASKKLIDYANPLWEVKGVREVKGGKSKVSGTNGTSAGGR